MKELGYGSWPSPITPSMLASAGVRLGQARLDDGIAYWLEGRPTEGGRVVLVKDGDDGSPVDLTPDGFNVRSMAHEYGGGAFTVQRGTVVFSNFDDQRLYRQEPGGAPSPITPETDRRHRYADGHLTADGASWIGVRERHEGSGRPDEVVNELVSLPADGSGDATIIAGGRDFYSCPRISPDGAALSFLAWDLPWMPWDGCEMYVGSLGAGGELTDVRHVAGRDGEESIWQPSWSPSGELHFASDRTGWWNLERIRGGERQPLHPAEMEFGFPAWLFGSSSYGFLADGRIVCAYTHLGVLHLALLDPETGEMLDLDVPHDAAAWGPSVSVEGNTIVFVAGAPTIPAQVVRLDVGARSIEVLKQSATTDVPVAYFSVPRQIEFPTEGGVTAFAHFYPPVNPETVAPHDELPPLIVMSHGGPTGASSPVFDLEAQFWTSRGFAVVDVNYGGSTGFGRAFRQRLNGNWGVVDLQDCVNAARYLVDRSEVDGERLLIRGGSAGGYTTLCALTFTDAFTAGTSYFGISDLEPFASGETHKFESAYEHTLVGSYPEAADVYRERSPINHVDRLATPMLLLQGADDEVVPPSQAEVMVEALERKRLPYAYLLFEGEGHGFRRADTIVAAIEAELSFYAQILGFERDDVPRLEILNLA